MDMPEPECFSLTADEEAMDWEPSLLTFTIDIGVAQSADGSLFWLLQLPSGQHNLEEEEEEASEFLDLAGDDDEEAVQAEQQGLHDSVVLINLEAQLQGVDFETVLQLLLYDGDGAYDDDGSGGAVVVPASAAAVAALEKHAFHARATVEGCDSECCVTGCSICLEEFEDGEEVTVMPCSSGGHEFHPGCITQWLGQRNTCPLCRHALPTDFEEFLDDASDYYDEDLIVDEEITQTMTLHLQDLTARQQQGAHLGGGGGGGEEGAVFVPASGAAVAGPEKQAIHATAEGRCAITRCAICFENFEDVDEVIAMPCFRGHGFHADCVTEYWLGNTCPLCCHEDDVMDEDIDDL